LESAGLEPGKLNPLAIEVMKEAGIDISQNKTKSVFDFYKQESSMIMSLLYAMNPSQRPCPVFPGKGERASLGFADPAALRAPTMKNWQKHEWSGSNQAKNKRLAAAILIGFGEVGVANRGLLGVVINPSAENGGRVLPGSLGGGLFETRRASASLPFFGEAEAQGRGLLGFERWWL
jgi:hypothetical protein